MTREVKCPRCKGPSNLSSENLFRPFCSERCRLIDLGDWASENFRVPDQETKIDIHGESENSDEE